MFRIIILITILILLTIISQGSSTSTLGTRIFRWFHCPRREIDRFSSALILIRGVPSESTSSILAKHHLAPQKRCPNYLILWQAQPGHTFDLIYPLAPRSCQTFGPPSRKVSMTSFRRKNFNNIKNTEDKSSARERSFFPNASSSDLDMSDRMSPRRLLSRSG